jgi:hypothetical protein
MTPWCRDLIGLSGLALLGAGLWLEPALALAVLGLALLAIAVLRA